MRGKQGIAQGAVESGGTALPVGVAEDTSRQRVAVGVQAGGWEANQDVTRADTRARDQVGKGRDTHHEARQVVVLLLVEAGQLGGLTAHERHPVGQACPGHPRHQGRGLRGLQTPDAEVVQEEERIGTLNSDVVDAMVDEVLAHGVVAVQRDRDLELGADAIGGGHQHWIGPSVGVEPEEAAEAANPAQDLRRRRARGRFADERHRASGFVEVDSGLAVRVRHA